MGSIQFAIAAADEIRKVIGHMLADFDITMTLCGCSNLSEANRAMLMRVVCVP